MESDTTQLETPKIKWGDLSDLRNGVDYTEDNTCIFYAIQEAHQDLVGSGFGEEKLEEFKKEYHSFLKNAQMENPVSTGGRNAYLSLKFSLQWISPLYLDVKSLTMQSETKELLKENGFPMDTFEIKQEEIEFPALLACQWENGNWHMFYAKNPQDYYKKKTKHLDPFNGTVGIAITVEKAKYQAKKHNPIFSH